MTDEQTNAATTEDSSADETTDKHSLTVDLFRKATKMI